MRLIYLYIGLFCLASITIAQSHDEEETVHYEGSANAPTDDEDIAEGSGNLPPDVAYTTNPVKPRVTTTPLLTTTTQGHSTASHFHQTTTVVKQDKIQPQTFPATRISTRPTPPPYNVNAHGSESTGVWYSASNLVIIFMVLVIVAIFVGIFVIICCCKKQRQYTPAKQVES